MALSLRVHALGEEIVHRDLLRFEENLTDPRPALEAGADVIRNAVAQQFETEGAYASGGWAPLAESTVAQKRRRGLDPHILRATGVLRASLIEKFAAGHREVLSGASLVFGSTVTYGPFHQSGTRRMPRRPPVALRPADKRRIVKEMQEAMIAGVRAAGRVAA